MSKDNMEELQRYRIVGNGIVEADNGVVVRFSDVAERDKEARELAAKASAARIRADRNADARWKERIQGEINDRERRIGQALGADGDHSMAGRHQEVVRALRSLLDSGEERDCPACGNPEKIETTDSGLKIKRCCFGGKMGPSEIPSPALEGPEKPEPGLIGVCSHDDQNWWQADKSLFCPEDNPYCDPVFYRRCAADTGESD
jgi:hypothetical protein